MRFAAIALFLLASSCGRMLPAGDDGGTLDAAGEGSLDAGPCPAVDAGNCRFARRALGCGNAFCVTDDDACPLGHDGDCLDLCDAGEFGAACGGGPIMSDAPPTSACRVVAQAPNGLVVYCCSCPE